LADEDIHVSGDTMVDMPTIDAPTLTKNGLRRDPEMHQACKGNQC
jgi:hypothetical protein